MPFKKGQGYWLGKKRPDMSEKLKGHRVSEKTREQCGSIWRGKCPPTAFKKGHPAPKTAFKKGHTPWNKGKKLPERSGENSPTWKGEKAGYIPKHSWVYRHKGKPNVCQGCGVTCQEKKLEWANIDHKYRRNLDDYISFCRVCHRARDKKFNSKEHGKTN